MGISERRGETSISTCKARKKRGRKRIVTPFLSDDVKGSESESTVLFGLLNAKSVKKARVEDGDRDRAGTRGARGSQPGSQRIVPSKRFDRRG
jgi:hypothetical protein